MEPSEWLKNISQNGSNGISDSARSVLSLLEQNDSETLWTVLVLLSACFSDLAKAGHVNSLPPNLDPATAAPIFTHLSNTMADAAQRLNGLGSVSSGMRELGRSIEQREQ